MKTDKCGIANKCSTSTRIDYHCSFCYLWQEGNVFAFVRFSAGQLTQKAVEEF